MDRPAEVTTEASLSHYSEGVNMASATVSKKKECKNNSRRLLTTIETYREENYFWINFISKIENPLCRRFTYI